LTLMTNSCVNLMPHEIFQGYFIAGIVLYRQIRQQQTLLAQLRRSALDNCQMILNDARESCDAAQWMMCIFDFLLSSTPELAEPEPTSSSAINSYAASSTRNKTVDDQLYHNESSLYSMDWDLPLQNNSMGILDDFFFIPNLYAPTDGTPDLWS